MLSVVGKLYGGVLIKRVSDGTECAIGEKQCVFRQDIGTRGCMGQVFAKRQLYEKYLLNGQDVLLVFMDLENMFMQLIDLVCGICKSVWSCKKIVKSSAIIYIDSMACAMVEMDVSEWFPFNVELRQSCLMSPWLLKRPIHN